MRRVRKWSLVLVALLFMFLVLWWARTVYTDILWFDQLGVRSVYTKILLLKLWLFVGGTMVSAAALSFTFYLAFRFSMGQSTLAFSADTFRLLGALLMAAAVLTVLIASPIFGSQAAGRWETMLLFFNKIDFGSTDAQFGMDLSFFVVTMRMLNFVQGWFMGLMITAVVASLALYAGIYSLRGLGLVLAPRMLKHLAVLGLLLMLTIAAGHALNVYDVVLSSNGVVFGATYTDINARIPVFWLLTGIALLAAAGFGISNYRGGLRLMVGFFSLWVIVFLLANFAYPALFQRLRVEPSEFDREAPYILRNIEATRAAYELDRVTEVLYPVAGTLTLQAIEDNRPTVDNIRLWDLQPLQDAYNQLQFMELYYQFLDMDSDRYVVDGRLRQVLVGARELDPVNLPPDAQNWVNQRLQYTHGYGISMSPATTFSPGEGRPEYFMQDIPIKGEFPISRPELYYGETPVNYAIVNTAMPEVDPKPGFLHYDGDGGVPLNSRLRRLAYAWQLTDINILLSDQITSDSRIQYRRDIRDRVGQIAPFLKLDHDPYPVLDTSGKLWWLLDAYTATNRYPYSTPFRVPLAGSDNTVVRSSLNYIRNSVKVVVDAYNGDVDFYVMDAEDPMLKMYRRAFPTLFQDGSEMPPDLRDHIRYPIGMFSTQARMYLRYHVTDAKVFFNQAEQWATPLETRFGKHGVRMTPSYVVLRNPGEEEEEFVLMLPFTPAGENKNNLVGWLIARNDSVNYGELISFQVPSNPQIDGPSQVEARIENDQRISQQFTLWEGAGSEVIRGQLLVIPIADTLIYVEPLYLQSEVLSLPELKKVIVADAEKVVMADTVDEAMIMLAGGGEPVPRPAGAGTSPESGALEELARLQEAVDGLGEALGKLQEALGSLRESLGGNTQ
ncbi:MAG: hypothetical protein BZY88_15690 [SAR202 cluster bacterium Io17-Chloro-G9]|nr:MAG: hypothetical protein BZY88_15690 [SAR202 cluster bacterium Io17-Chloro-G9]